MKKVNFLLDFAENKAYKGVLTLKLKDIQYEFYYVNYRYYYVLGFLQMVVSYYGYYICDFFNLLMD